MPDGTDIDYDRLGKAVAEHMHASCPLGWTVEDIETLRDFARSVRSAKERAWATVVTLLVTAIAGLVLAGIWAKIANIVRTL